MTRDGMLKIMYAHGYRADMGDIADRILAVLESERQGEVVLWSGIYESTIRAAHKDECHHKLLGKRGVLVFIPEGK